MRDEQQYWADVSNKPRNRDEKEDAKAFYDTLDPIVKDFRLVTGGVCGSQKE